jgi:hypothetical protein
VERILAAPQVSERELAGDPWMTEYVASLEHRGKQLVAAAEMIDPDAGVDQDHRAGGRRRGIATRSGCVPPSLARHRALSRSINAVSASRTSTVLSFVPVRRCASATSSSSSARVVLIARSRSVGTF